MITICALLLIFTLFAPRIAGESVGSLTPCTACLAQGGLFARRSGIEACFFTQRQELPDATWTRVTNCFAADDCPPLPTRLTLSPVPLCYDIAQDPVGARTLLVVFWGYTYSTHDQQPVTFNDGDCHNSFAPVGAAVPPRVLVPGYRQQAFVAITGRGVCQRWRLGDEEAVVCADTLPSSLGRCTHVETNPPDTPPRDPEPDDDDWGEDTDASVMEVLAGRESECYTLGRRRCRGHCVWCDGYCAEIGECIERS